MNTKIIIFSKNRAIMLEALLRSLNNKYDIYIIYKFTNSGFQAGYEKLIWNNTNNNIHYILEHNFKNDLLNIMKEIEQVCFMVDDDIVFDNNFVIPELEKFETKSEDKPNKK